MKTIALEGAEVPALGFGTWMLKGEACVRAVGHALSVGYRHVDTASAYGNEAEVGRAIAESSVPRADVFLTTKIWPEDLDRVRDAAEESLRLLGTDYVDLLLVHWPTPQMDLERVLDDFVALRDDGATRFIGVSNFPPSLFDRAAAHAPVACNQIEYHPYLAQDALIERARRVGAFVTAYSPIARGRVVKDPVIGRIAARHQKSPVQVTLRWLVQQDRVAAIPKAGSPEHVEANIDIWDFELDAGEMREIRGLARGERLIDPDFAPDWER